MADAPLPGQTYACFVRSQHACADIKSIDTKAALAIKGVIAVLTAADIKAANVGNLSQHPPVAGPRRRQADHAGAAGAGGRPGAPHRRGGRHGDRRDLRGGAGRRRGGRGGLCAARSGHRSARGREARRAAGVAGGAGQHRGRLGRACRQSRRDGGEGRRGDEVRRACRAHLARAPAHQRRLDGAARRHRELRRGQRQLPAPRLLAGRARHARLDGGRDGHSAGENPRHHRGGRRRVRAQDRALSGIHRDAGRREEDRPPGVLDVGAQRILRQRQPRPRRLQRRRAGARRQGQVPGAAHPPSRQHGRLHRRGRRQHPDRQHDALPARHVRHQADRRADQMRVHQHHADRALSRRRPPGGELLHRARGRRGRARHRHRSDPAAAEEPDFEEGDAVQDRGRHHLRQRRLRHRRRQGPGARRLRRLQGAQEASRRRRACCAASASASCWSTPAARRSRARKVSFPGGEQPDVHDERAVDRPGPRHDLPAARRRAARHQGRAGRPRPRRFARTRSRATPRSARAPR